MMQLWPTGGRRGGWLVRLGRVEYAAAWALQRRLAAARHAGQVPDLLLLVEHPPTFTLGRTGRAEHLLADAAALERLGATVFEVDRGGDITYHGPGQLVGYPIINLADRGRDVHGYLRLLEETLMRALAEFGIVAGRCPPYTGVWVGQEKVAAIGVKVSRGVTLHGFALNIATDLRYFEAIVPCGIRDRGVTSLARLLGTAPPADSVERLVADHFGQLAGLDWCRLDRAERSVAQLEAALLAGLSG